MTKGIALGTATLLIMLSGCGYFGDRQGLEPVSVPRDQSAPQGSALESPGHRARIALDLITALQQVPGYAPEEMPLDITLLQGAFGETLVRVFAARGYRSTGEDTSGTSRVDFRTRYSPKNGLTTVILGAGTVKFKRDYRLRDDAVEPASLLFVLGASPEHIVPDDSIFAARSAPRDEWNMVPSGIQPDYATLTTPGIDVSAASPVNLPLIVYDRSFNANATTDPDTVSPLDNESLIESVSSENMWELGESNFREVFAGYRDVERRVLVFANDSIVLGPENKWRLATMARRFNPDSDSFSVIGCSAGKTALPAGNEGLARGRAASVTRELLTLGIRDDQIRDEGCWAGTGKDWDQDLPVRGVVVTLKRRG